MKQLVALSVVLAALLAGCAYEPGEWYGIHAAVPQRQTTKYMDNVGHTALASPVASAPAR